MAVLSTTDRKNVCIKYSEDVSKVRSPLNLSKADLKAAVDAIDQWVEDNTTAYNNAIPQPARGILTLEQKSTLLNYVTKRRVEVLLGLP